MPRSFNSLTATEISARLAETLRAYPRNPAPEFPYPNDFLSGPARPAAVLMPLLRQGDAWQVLLTRRTPSLHEHSGQVAFPGGRADPGDVSPEATALREAREEIGLDPQDVKILGRLYEFITISNYLVTPVVGVMPWPYPLRLQEDEVSRIFTIPLDWLADPANQEVRARVLPDPYPPVDVYYFRPYDGELLWGVSARFMVTFLKILQGDEQVPSALTPDQPQIQP